jgi:hypothetical protein
MKKTLLLTILLICGTSSVFSQNPPNSKPDGEFSKGEKPKPKFPLHWGKPPLFQTKDIVDLPGKFGKGSSTLASWIKNNIQRDVEKRESEILTDDERKNPRLIESETLKAVKDGKISKEEARKKLDALREEMAKTGERKLPRRPQKPEISEEVKSQIDAVKELEKAIHSEIKAQVAELGKDATKEEIKSTVEAFKESNKDRFEAIKEAHSSIRTNLEANRPEKPERPELTDDLKVKVDALHAKRKEMHEAQKELHKNLKDASQDEKKEMITAFKEANKEKHDNIKAQAKEVKEEIRALVETDATRTSDL